MDYEITVPSPAGSLRIRANPLGLTALVIQGQKHQEDHLSAPALHGSPEDAPESLRLAGRWLEEYFAGQSPDPAVLPLAPAGTPFQQRVWQAIREIPYGQTVTYGDLASRLGSSARAVGQAVGRNPLAIVVPCHRVVGKKGLTGYAGGLEVKKLLLALEREGR